MRSTNLLPPLMGRPNPNKIKIFNRTATFRKSMTKPIVGRGSLGIPRAHRVLPALLLCTPQASPEISARKRVSAPPQASPESFSQNHKTRSSTPSECQASPQIPPNKPVKARRGRSKCIKRRDAFTECLHGQCKCHVDKKSSPTFKSIKKHLVERWGQDIFNKRREEALDYMFSINTTSHQHPEEECRSPHSRPSPKTQFRRKTISGRGEVLAIDYASRATTTNTDEQEWDSKSYMTDLDVLVEQCLQPLLLALRQKQKRRPKSASKP